MTYKICNKEYTSLAEHIWDYHREYVYEDFVWIIWREKSDDEIKRRLGNIGIKV